MAGGFKRKLGIYAGFLLLVAAAGSIHWCLYYHPRDAYIQQVFDCMRDPSHLEWQRCAHQVAVGDVDGDGHNTWHDAYIFDHCQSSPESCVDGEPAEVFTGLDRIAEQMFCTPDVCPGRCCYCVKGDDGQWWIDDVLIGNDDDECEEILRNALD